MDFWFHRVSGCPSAVWREEGQAGSRGLKRGASKPEHLFRSARSM